MLKKQISEYQKTNQLAGKKYQEMYRRIDEVAEKFHNGVVGVLRYEVYQKLAYILFTIFIITLRKTFLIFFKCSKFNIIKTSYFRVIKIC